MSDGFNWMSNMLSGAGVLVGTPEIDENLMIATVTASEGRTQLLFIMEGSDYWLFASPFAETSQVTAEQALQVVNTADLPSGVRQFGNKFALVRFLDKGDIQVPEIAKVCAKVSIWADAIEDALGLGDSL